MAHPDPLHSYLTHTFSECVENHAGMQTIGTKREFGFSEQRLEECAAKFPDHATIHKLDQDGETASILVVKGGVNLLQGFGAADRLLAESAQQPFDTTFLNTRRKVVQTKHGRNNNCYADVAQQPDIPQGMGTIIDFATTPEMARLRAELPRLLGSEAENLFAETNWYTDIRKRKVGIGFHGDTERSVVVGVRLGQASQPLRFQWYRRSKAISKEHVIHLAHGDVYAMSHKATGQDWKCPSKTTLRHGVGRKAVERAIGK